MATPEELESRNQMLLQGLVNSLTGGFVNVMPGLVNTITETLSGMLRDNAVRAWDATINEWVSKNFCDADTGQMLRRLRDETFPIGTITTVVMRISMLLTLIKSVAEVMTLDRQYNMLSQTTPHPAPVDNLVRSMMVDPGRANENRTQMKRLGYSDTQIDNIILSHYALVPEAVIRVNYLRGNITSDRMFERMRELGYTDTRIREIIQTWTLYPGPQDLFTMVAHEAFEPQIYGPLGLSDEFPEDQVPWLEAQGISREWAMKYWISHWNQPSIQQGFEMLHRGVIDRSELDMLMKVVEIPQFWRDKLMAITYNPYTRVDTRRMHELGVLTTQELVQSYQDIGYSAEKAVKMAEFTIRYNAEGDKQLTRSIILDSFRSDLISRNDANELLKEAGYSDDVADFYLTHEEYKQALDIQKMYIGIIEDQYKLSMTSEAETRSQLNQQNLRGSKIDALMDQWTLEKYKYQDLPTHAELNSLLIEKIINEGQWREVMTRRGYSSQHQAWYLKLIDRAVTVSRALPTKTEINNWYKKKMINESQYRTEMKQLGYSDYYIDLYLKTM
uniref:Putative carbamoyl phosphate synthetase n=1 Tax=viral metagenome TaxID=1070528 RepID=A0A6H1ZU05_9ZZZZ